MELAKEFTGGNHQLVACTHTDKDHLHNDIYWNSTTLDCSGKFDNVKDSAMLVRRLSDKLCYEQGLSVVEVPSEKGVSYDVWQDKQKGIDWKQLFKINLLMELENKTGGLKVWAEKHNFAEL